MKTFLLSVGAMLLLITAIIFWKRDAYYTPRVYITVVDESSGKPISQALVKAGWYGMSFEGFSIKEEWYLSDKNGQVVIPPFRTVLYFSSFDGLSCEILHPIYEQNYWTDGISPTNESLATRANPPSVDAVVKMKSYAVLMERSNCCNEQRGRSACTPAYPDYGKLTFNFKWYFFLLREHGLKTNIEVQDGLVTVKSILRNVFRNCEDKYLHTVRELENAIK